MENKKTFLYIKTLELAHEIDQEILIGLYSSEIKPELKVIEVKKLFQKYKADIMLLEQIESFTLSAFKHVELLSIDKSKKQILIDFGKSLMKRRI